MCGRFSRFTGQDVIESYFGVDIARTDLLRRYNIAPSQNVPVVYRENPIILDDMRWGFIPFWAEKPGDGPNPINARADSLEKNMYKKSLRSKRCIIPADGFYEWKEIHGQKQPYFIRMNDKKVMGLGGIYSEIKSSRESVIRSFAIITTEPNDTVSKIHKRMPLILEKSDYDTWLDPSSHMDGVHELIKPYDNGLTSYPVSKKVNKPDYDVDDCIKPIDMAYVGRDEQQDSLDKYF